MRGYPVQPGGRPGRRAGRDGRVRFTESDRPPQIRGRATSRGPVVSTVQSSRGGVNRTLNRSFWRRVLYQLSYAPVGAFSGQHSAVSQTRTTAVSHLAAWLNADR